MQSATTLPATTCSQPIEAPGTSPSTFRYFFFSCYILLLHMYFKQFNALFASCYPHDLRIRLVWCPSPCHHPRSSDEQPSGATYALTDLAFTANLARLNFRTMCTHFSSCLSYRPSFLVVSLLLLYQPHSFAKFITILLLNS